MHVFASHFSSVYLLPRNLQQGNTSQTLSNNFTLFDITQHDILLAILKLPPKKSCCYDSITSCIVKGCAEIFVPLLAHIFALPFEQFVSPSAWKKRCFNSVAEIRQTCCKLSTYLLATWHFLKFSKRLFTSTFKRVIDENLHNL